MCMCELTPTYIRGHVHSLDIFSVFSWFQSFFSDVQILLNFFFCTLQSLYILFCLKLWNRFQFYKGTLQVSSLTSNIYMHIAQPWWMEFGVLLVHKTHTPEVIHDIEWTSLNYAFSYDANINIQRIINSIPIFWGHLWCWIEWTSLNSAFSYDAHFDIQRAINSYTQLEVSHDVEWTFLNSAFRYDAHFDIQRPIISYPQLEVSHEVEWTSLNDAFSHRVIFAHCIFWIHLLAKLPILIQLPEILDICLI